MTTIVYPLTLPAPVAAPIVSDERRLLSALEGARVAGVHQRDRLAQQALTFVYSYAQAATFRAWWKDELTFGAAWFSSTWSLPQGGTGVRRFLGMPKWELLPGFGWRVSANSEVRGVGLPPVLNVDGTLIWDQTAHDTGAGAGNMALSAGGKTVTHTVSVSSDMARASISQSAGKWYFEILIGGTVNNALPYCPGCGFTTSTTLPFGPSDVVTWMYGADGDILRNSVTAATGPTVAAGSVIGWAIDLDAGKAWASSGGVYVASGNPATGASPVFTFTANVATWPATSMNSNVPSATIRGAAAEFATAPPAGFLPWARLP